MLKKYNRLRRHLLVGDPHADVWSAHQRGGCMGGMSHAVLYGKIVKMVELLVGVRLSYWC